MRDLIDNTGTNRNRIRYDSFGNITNQTNPSLTFRFGYTGRDFDSETGLNYYRARYYDARVGRFLSEDPIGFAGGDANLYRYVGNSPVNYTDPSGMIAVVPILIGAGLLPIVFDALWSPVQTPIACGDVYPKLPWCHRLPENVLRASKHTFSPDCSSNQVRIEFRLLKTTGSSSVSSSVEREKPIIVPMKEVGCKTIAKNKGINVELRKKR